MHTLLLVAIVVAGALGVIRKIPPNRAGWIVVALALYGTFTSPDVPSRMAFVIAAIAGPLLAYPLTLLFSLTLRPLWHYFTFRAESHRTQFLLLPDDPRYAQVSLKTANVLRGSLALGFRSHGRIAHEFGTFTAVNEFLELDNGRAWAIVTAVLSETPHPVIIHCGTLRSSGEYLIVNNLSYVDPSAPAPGYLTWRLPSISKLGDLVRLMEFIAARSGPVVPEPMDGDLLTRSKLKTKTRFEAEREAGYWRYDAALDAYRPTLKGSFRQHWVSLPPLRGIIDRREKAFEKTLLAEMGLTPVPRTDLSDGQDGAEKPTPKTYLELAFILVFVMALAAFGPEVLAEMGGERYERPLPRVDVAPNLTVPDAFPDAVRLLELVVGQPSHRLSGTVDDNPAPTKGVAISMHRDSAAAFVAAAQEAFLAKGFYLFRTGERFSGFDTDGLALWPGRDPYEIMKAMDTNGANHRLLVDDVIAWFKREESQNPFRFDAIGFDYVGGRILGGLQDGSGFAGRFIKFCPDLMMSGDVTVRILSRDLERTREFFCWWD